MYVSYLPLHCGRVMDSCINLGLQYRSFSCRHRLLNELLVKRIGKTSAEVTWSVRTHAGAWDDLC